MHLNKLSKTKGFSIRFNADTFNEIVLKCPRPASEIRDALLEYKILAGLPLGDYYQQLDDSLLICATEHRIFKVPGYVGKVGIIPAFTRSLCGKCNRIRVTADGKIRNCLYSDDEFDLKGLIRNGATDMEIGKEIRHAMWMKPKDGWVAQRQGDHGRESMTQIGG